ncbi:uncharacterized protein LOC134820841 [Bolinopsis microptera]|uniref:uncharacterized protein LOC134820841 n=1 Tax=Bolinopsis microptera TaxID=2820187 RepID=UPI00307A05B5
MLLMFIAVGYEFSDDDRRKIKAKLSGVERELFTRYLEANSMCLEEIGDTIPINPLKMVLDRNDKKDFNDVVKVMMIGEVKAHFLPQDSIDINVRQVLHCVRKNCHTSNMTVSAVLEITNLLDGKTQKKGSSKLSQKIRSGTQSFTKLLRMKPSQVAILIFLFGLFSEFAIGIFMYYLDVISDVLLAVELYEKDSDLTSYTNQATQVLCFTFIPQGLIGIFLGVQYLKKRDMMNVIFSLLCFVGLGPVVVAFECVATSMKWYNEGHILESHEDREKRAKKKQKQEKKPKQNPSNRFSPPEGPPGAPFEPEWTHPLDKEQKPPKSGRDDHPKPLKDLLDEQIERWNAIRIWEASLESGPEILLQLYIAMCTNTYSILSLALSFFSLVQAAAEYYYCKASGAIGIPHLIILSSTTTLFLISRLLSAFSFIFKYGVVILFPLAVFFVTIVVDIAVNWEKVENKVLHVTTYLSSLFILVRSKFERNSSGQQIMFYMLMIISNGLLVIHVVYPPTVGTSREQCDLCHQRNCTYEISDLTNQSTLSSVTYNKDTLVYKFYGEDPLDSWEFTVVMPAIILSSFVVGICGLVYYQHWLHPWRHIIATEPRFKTKDPADYSSKFLAGTLVATVFAVGDLILLGGICLKSYPDDTLRGVLYFVFPYVVTAVSMVFFVMILTFSPMKISDNLKLKAIGRPNFILTGLINIYKISGIQGSILVGILKFYRDDLNDGMLDLYIGLYIACVLLGVLTTVWLYMDSSLKRKLQGRLGHLNTVSDIWRGAKNNVLSVDQRGLSLSRNRPRPPVFDETPPNTPPALPDRKSSLDAGIRKPEPIKTRQSETPLPPPGHTQQNNDNNKQPPQIRPPPPPASHPSGAKKGPQLKNGNPYNSRKGPKGPPTKGPAPPKGRPIKLKDHPPSEPAQLPPMVGPGGHRGMPPRRQRPPPRR